MHATNCMCCCNAHTRASSLPIPRLAHVLVMKKKVDPRVRQLLENAVASHTRAFFVIVGDKGREQVVNLHYIMSKATVKARPTVLWCYKKELGFSSHKQKRMKEIKKKAQRGQIDIETIQDDPFELFITSTKIRYCYYNETHTILGHTYGMLVLQDFEAMTPNLLARTIETVEGGGCVVLLLKTMTSLKQLYSMTMDVHSRFRTHSHQSVVARFNERFLLSLRDCATCLVLDDELNVLPVTAEGPLISLAKAPEGDSPDLAELKASLASTPPSGVLVALAKTIDQAKAVLTFIEAISEKTLRSTVALTAGRGRGKSAALGISMAAAIAYGYSNILVTAPSPENLGMMFQFIVRSFEALGYKEHLDYDVVTSTNPAFNKAVVRVNVYRSHRQTIAYIQPQHAERASHAELLVIDEAAAIPLPLVKALFGPYLVFLSSTVNGYEGTGRSLSLKLIQQLRNQAGSKGDGASGRTLREVTLEEPIRYSNGDRVEKWLHSLLCLDCTKSSPPLAGGCPHPKECELFFVERDTLFSYHKASEQFLQDMMSLYVSSHYKNTPNDLQMLSDAPAHQLYVLLGPNAAKSGVRPDILCVVQVCMEGKIARSSAMSGLAQGAKTNGDLIPWTVSQQFQDPEFASLSGARVVRIATHPNLVKMGYGSRALQILSQYFSGGIIGNADEVHGNAELRSDDVIGIGSSSLLSDELRPRTNLPPMLVSLTDRPPEILHWIGVSYGITPELHKFWSKGGYVPVYLRQTANDITGEHTCIMLKQLQPATLSAAGGGAVLPADEWCSALTQDFRRRFVQLLGYEFRQMPVSVALSMLTPASLVKERPLPPHSRLFEVDLSSQMLSAWDVRRLDSYARSMVDWHVITDLIPTITPMILDGHFDRNISFTQAAILVGVGLQRRTVDDLQAELQLDARQLLANFNKVIIRVVKTLQERTASEAGRSMPAVRIVSNSTVLQPLHVEMAAAAGAVKKKMHAEEAALLADVGASMYAVEGDEASWVAALQSSGTVPSVISVKASAGKSKRQLEQESFAAAKSKRDEKESKEKETKAKEKKTKKSKHH